MSEQSKKSKYAHEKSRMFDGKRYTRAFHFATKREAKYFADTKRTQGKSVRIVPEVGGYLTYVRG